MATAVVDVEVAATEAAVATVVVAVVATRTVAAQGMLHRSAIRDLTSP